MKAIILIVIAAAVVVAAPAEARSSALRGVVLAKQPQRGTLVVATSSGVGLTVKATTARVEVGDRVLVRTARAPGGLLRATSLRVLARARGALVRGVVVRTTRRAVLVATGRSVIRIRQSAARTTASARDGHDLRVGEIGEFRIRFDENELVEENVQAIGHAGTVTIEGTLASVTPLVVSVEGLPITITVPAGVALPAGLATGQRLELTVQVGAANQFTLVSVDEIENVNPAVAPDQEVEVKGVVVSSTTTELVLKAGGVTFTFVAPAGTTLPLVAAGTFVEARGVSSNGALTLTRLRVEDGGGGGDGGGGDGGGH